MPPDARLIMHKPNHQFQGTPDGAFEKATLASKESFPTMTNDEIKIILKHTAVPDNFLAEIGRVTAHFALLEYDLIELTHQLLGLSRNMARAITSELSFRGLQQLAASLLRERFPSEVEKFESVLAKVSKAEERRNTVSHSLWGDGGKSKDGERVIVRTKYTAKQKNGLKFVRQELTASDLRGVAYQISIAAYEVEQFRNQLPSGA